MNAFDSKAKRAAYLGALKTLDAGPRKIAEAKEQYNEDQQNIRKLESSGNYAPAYVKRMRDAAQGKRDDTIRKTVDGMKSALDAVKAHKSSSERIDISDSRIQDVIRTVGAMGKDLSFDTQISIVESFRGDAPALNFVSDLFRRNNLFAADYAKSLTKDVSDQAVSDLEEAFIFYDYSGQFDESRIHWSRGEFAAALERNTIDPGADPYVVAMREMKHMSRDDAGAQEIFGAALSGIAKNEAEGVDVDTAAVLNEALAAMEADA